MKPKTEAESVVTFRLPKALLRQVDDVALDGFCKRSAAIRQLIRAGLKARARKAA